MKRKRFPSKGFLILILLLAVLCFASYCIQRDKWVGEDGNSVLNFAEALLNPEPEEVQKLRKQNIAQMDEGHQEYYFSLCLTKRKECTEKCFRGFGSGKKKFI